MNEPTTQTLTLLRRWHSGDDQALGEILRRDMPWIRSRVRRRLGPHLRGKEETLDIVQDAVIDFLRYGPRFEIADKEHFRRLMARIVENTLRDRNDWYRAQRRALDKERPIPRDTILNLDAARRPAAGPGTMAERNEQEALIRLALELLDPDDRKIVVLRQLEGRSFVEVGEALAIEANTARMRFKRALPRLAAKLSDLRSGKIVDALMEEEGDPLTSSKGREAP